METVQILKQAKALIKQPKRWHKGDFSNRSNSSPTCWCAVGAIGHVLGIEDGDVANLDDQWIDPAMLLAEAMGKEIDENDDIVEEIGNYNDNENTTHADIMRAFDEAIELARKK